MVRDRFDAIALSDHFGTSLLFQVNAAACKIHEVTKMAIGSVSGKIEVIWAEIVAEQACHRMCRAALSNKAFCSDENVL